jgi:hypothetical protein
VTGRDLSLPLLIYQNYKSNQTIEIKIKKAICDIFPLISPIVEDLARFIRADLRNLREMHCIFYTISTTPEEYLLKEVI